MERAPSGKSASGRLAELSPADEELLAATRHKDQAGVRRSLRRGASPNACEADLLTPVHLAAEAGSAQLLGEVIARGRARGWSVQLDGLTVFGNTPLVLAVRNNRTSCVQLLLQLPVTGVTCSQSGANPNGLSLFERTPLHVATFFGRAESVVLLLKFGADVNAVDCFFQTPLSLALVSRNSVMIVKWLLQAGANPNFRTKSSLPLLSTAVLGSTGFRDLRYLTFLLSAGAEVGARDRVKADTALHLAAARGFRPAVDLLVAAGAELGAENAYGETPLNVAIRFGNRLAAFHIYFLEEEKEEEELALLEERRLQRHQM